VLEAVIWTKERVKRRFKAARTTIGKVGAEVSVDWNRVLTRILQPDC